MKRYGWKKFGQAMSDEHLLVYNYNIQKKEG